MAPPEATDALNERPVDSLAEETTKVAAKATPALLLETDDDDANRPRDLDRATGPGALEVVGIRASTVLTILAALYGSPRDARPRPAPRAGNELGTEGCEGFARAPKVRASSAAPALALARAI